MSPQEQADLYDASAPACTGTGACGSKPHFVCNAWAAPMTHTSSRRPHIDARIPMGVNDACE